VVVAKAASRRARPGQGVLYFCKSGTSETRSRGASDRALNIPVGPQATAFHASARHVMKVLGELLADDAAQRARPA